MVILAAYVNSDLFQREVALGIAGRSKGKLDF